MKVIVNLSVLKETRWQEYAVRFVLGGVITVLTGLIAKKFGPAVGGLFLAYPAIFPASATLIEKHEKERKLKVGVRPGHRGRDASALDAAGATMGGLALIVFAVAVWKLLPAHSAWMVLLGSTVLWLVVSVSIWLVIEHI